MQAGEHLARLRTVVGADRELQAAITDDDGVIRDLTGYSSATVSARLGSTYKISAANVTIEDGGSTGYVSFTPDSGDIDVSGDYRAMIRFVTALGAIDYSDEFIIEVSQPIYDTG